MYLRFSPWRLALGVAAALMLLSIAVVNRQPYPLAELDGACRTLADSILKAVGGTADDLRHLRTPGGEIVDFAVRIDGLPVLGGRIRLSRGLWGPWRTAELADLPLDARSRPLRFDPLPHALSLVDTTGSLRGRPAVEPAWFRHEGRWINGAVVRLPLWRFDGEILPWHGEAPDAGLPADLEMRFDSGGTLLEARDLLIRFGRAGSGLVFDPNPVVTSGDRDLRNGDPVDAWRVEIALDQLDETGRLQGSRVRVETRDRLFAQEADRRYHYPSNDPRFEEVMAYYHIDRALAWIASLGYADLFTQPQRVTVHASPLDNSWYSPITGRINYGDGGVDDAEDADIILHELGHAIHDLFVPGFGEGDTRAISEGFSDYLAANLTGDPCIGDWDSTTYSPPCLRRTDEVLRFPDDLQGNPHADGRIWSGALWEIRERLGTPLASLLILEGLLRQTPSSSFCDAAEELIRAAEALGLSSYNNEIQAILADRGLLERTGLLHLTGDEGAVVPLDKRWPGAPDAGCVRFHADGSAAIGDSLRLLPLCVPAPGRIEISYAARDNSFGWEWTIRVDQKTASGRVTLAEDGSLDLVWLGEESGWPEGEVGILRDGEPAATITMEDAFGGAQAPPSFTFPVGGTAAKISDSRVTLRRESSGWRIEMWLASAPSDRLLLRSLSNPAFGAMPIRIDLPEPGPVRLTVHDVTGRRVRTLLNEDHVVEGPRRLIWDGCDGSGRSTPAGVYWIRLQTARFQRSVRIVRLGG